MIRIARIVLMPMLVGALALGSAWAGTGLAPAPVPVTPDELAAQALSVTAATTADGLTGSESGEAVALALPDSPTGLYAGAGKVEIYPDPDPENGEVWAKSGCATLGGDAASAFGHMGDLTSPWPDNPDCIYMGGYGIGPMNAATEFDREYGLWARAAAVSNGTETLVFTYIDGVYWFGEYGSMCDGCGWYDLHEELGAELGIDPSNFISAATHSHTAPDFIGGWGGVPTWYMEQVADAIRTSIREAVGTLRPAVLEAGEELARQHNNERRNTYRSAEESGLSWFRALEADTGDTIVTIGAYAAHPTTRGSSGTIADADWPGRFNVHLERRFDGIGLHFMTGLGNMSARGGTAIGERLADMIPEPGEGTPVVGNVVAAAQARWDQPVTNSVLLALGGGGFFDRPFSGPAQVSRGKAAARPCVSAAPVSVSTSVTGARIGNLVISAAPGEIFSNYSNAVKERYPDTVVFPLGMANDAMGYIMQSFETFDEGRQALGFSSSAPGIGSYTEYEDAYSIDRCFGDVALETTVSLLAGLHQ